MIADTIEFCLTHENEIRLALEEKKDGANRGGVTGGNGSGHMRISDPTAIQALRRVAEIVWIDVPYGPYYGTAPVCDKETGIYGPDRRWQNTYRLRYPEKWLRVVAAIKKRYMEPGNRLHNFFVRRYVENEAWQKTCKETGISRGTYYVMRAEIHRAAEVYAVGCGAVKAEDVLE